MKFIRYILIILIATSFLFPVSAIAQDEVTAPRILQVEGLAIDPFLIEVNSTPGSTENRSIKLSNTTDNTITFVASINDFVPNATTGQAQFLDSDKETDPKYSLSSWITITKQPSFVIPPHGSTTVEFSINIPQEAEPSTHYGGILFGRSPVNVGPGASAVAVQQKVGAIILVKLGNSSEQVQLESIVTNKQIYQKGPIEFTTLINNIGNVHTKAKGDITIRNMFGVPIDQVPVNRDAQIILPQTQRNFVSSWLPKFAIGRYTAEADIFYGNPKLELKKRISFWVLPAKEIILSVLFLVILGIILYIAVKKYNQYIIKHSR